MFHFLFEHYVPVELDKVCQPWVSDVTEVF